MGVQQVAQYFSITQAKHIHEGHHANVTFMLVWRSLLEVTYLLSDLHTPTSLILAS